MSTLAATTCSSTARPAAARDTVLRRSRRTMDDAAVDADPVADRRKIGGVGAPRGETGR